MRIASRTTSCRHAVSFVSPCACEASSAASVAAGESPVIAASCATDGAPTASAHASTTRAPVGVEALPAPAHHRRDAIGQRQARQALRPVVGGERVHHLDRAERVAAGVRPERVEPRVRSRHARRSREIGPTVVQQRVHRRAIEALQRKHDQRAARLERLDGGVRRRGNLLAARRGDPAQAAAMREHHEPLDRRGVRPLQVVDGEEADVALDRARKRFEQAHARGEGVERRERLVGGDVGKQPRDVEPVGAQVLEPRRMRGEQFGDRAERRLPHALAATQPGRRVERGRDEPALADPRLPRHQHRGRVRRSQPCELDAPAVEAARTRSLTTRIAVVGSSSSSRAAATDRRTTRANRATRPRIARIPAARSPAASSPLRARLRPRRSAAPIGARADRSRPARRWPGLQQAPRLVDVDPQVEQRRIPGRVRPEDRGHFRPRHPLAVPREHEQDRDGQHRRQGLGLRGAGLPAQGAQKAQVHAKPPRCEPREEPRGPREPPGTAAAPNPTWGCVNGRLTRASLQGLRPAVGSRAGLRHAVRRTACSRRDPSTARRNHETHLRLDHPEHRSGLVGARRCTRKSLPPWPRRNSRPDTMPSPWRCSSTGPPPATVPRPSGQGRCFTTERRSTVRPLTDEQWRALGYLGQAAKAGRPAARQLMQRVLLPAATEEYVPGPAGAEAGAAARATRGGAPSRPGHPAPASISHHCAGSGT